MVKEENFNYADSAKALVSGEVDALFWTVGINATVVEELSRQCDIKLLSIDKEASDKLKSAYSYIDCKVDGNTYNGQTKDVNTVTGVNIPFHSGAAEYYSEKGIEVKTAE